MQTRIHDMLKRWLPLMGIVTLLVPALFAQAGPGFNTTVPSQIMDQFRSERVQWTTNVFIYANTLFGLLAVIEFAWSAAVMLLEKSDLQSWTSALIRKLMWIGAFYALLLNGRSWIPAIIDSFTQLGQNASGLGALSPSGIFMQGLSLAGALMDGASTSAFFTNPGTSLALAFAALLIVISYTFIAINFIVTFVESYLVVSVGFIFLGFGGSRWTAPYTERFIGLAVSIGVKVLLLYCLIAAGFDLSLGWLNEAQGIATSARPVMTAFDVMGGALDLHDVLLADSETVCSRNRRVSRLDGRRSHCHSSRSWQCRLCSGRCGGERTSRRGRCSSGYRFRGECWWSGFQYSNCGCQRGIVRRCLGWRKLAFSAIVLSASFRRCAHAARPSIP